MLRHIRKFAWLTGAVAVVLSLTLGAILAHEGRPVGDYRFIVGWLEEPAYEGFQNGVSVRINKIVEGEAMPEGEGEKHEAMPTGEAKEDDHGPPGHHGEEPESTPATSHEERESSESEDHHGAEDEERESSEGEDHHGAEDEERESSEGQDHHGAEDGERESSEGQDHHGAEDEERESSESEDHHGAEDGDSDTTHNDQDSEGGKDGAASVGHGAGGHHATTIEAVSTMSVDFETSADSVSGLNVQIIPLGFTFAATSVNDAHVAGEGHAHIYVNGEKVSRVYTPWYYIGDLEPGEHEIRVTLNANSLEEYTSGSSKVEAIKTVHVPEPHGHHHAAEAVVALARMEVSITLEPDILGGANLFVGTEGFTFAPQNAGDHHVPGEGHGHVYVNGVKIGRIYGGAMQLGKLAEGKNKVRVTLNNNEHSAYRWNGNPVEATATIEIGEGMGGTGYGDPPAGHHKPADQPGDETNVNGDQNHHGGNGEGGGMVEKETSRLTAPRGAAKPLATIMGQHEGVTVPVEGLEGSLQVEVIHVGSGASRILDLEAAWGDPGHYVATLIPTASGVYEFRVFGTIEGKNIDETFASVGAGGGFDDIQSSAELQFPEQLPEMREVVGAVQGARSLAQEAQDAALAAQAGNTAGPGGGNALAIVALIVGIAGAILGAGGILLALRARQPG